MGPTPPRNARFATIWFSLTLLGSAGLLFVVQPLVGRLLLPLLGGAPAVWNTCMVFFQAALLGGYLWAHLLATRLPPRGQFAAQIGLLLAGLLWLPLALSPDAALSIPTDGDPTGWLLVTLLTTVGLPFFALSASAPLLQRWYALGDHAGARDPYFLYAASNVGSVVALLAYPLWLEPRLGLLDQGRAWGWGYGALLLPLVAGCSALAWRWGRGATKPAPGSTAGSSSDDAAPPVDSLTTSTLTGWRGPLAWTALALVPSSLLLGVTTHLTTDIASVPLLWVVPLALYLVTWILAFSRWRVLATTTVARVFAIAMVAWLLATLSEATEPAWALVLLHLGAVFVASWMCHQRLADLRPPPERLTAFYLCLSLGGVLGGMFNTLLAPWLFDDLSEYPLGMLAAVAAMPALVAGRSLRPDWRDLAVAAAIGGLCAAVVLALPLPEGPARTAVVFGLPAVLAYAMVRRPQRFALAVAAILLAGQLHAGVHGAPVHTARSFFAVHKVTQDPDGQMHRIVHGNTLHGRQWLDARRRCQALAYYHHSGPVGDIVQALTSEDRLMRAGVVGLGAGAMATYVGARQGWTFYEIDPEVAAIARDPALFTYLSDCAQGRVDVVLGDARLRLGSAPDGVYDLLAVDAFASDAIPVHLLTTQAFERYLAKLAPGGLLAFHVSNRYLDLFGVLAAQARAAGLACRVRDDKRGGAEIAGVEPSRWVVMARQESFLGTLARHPRWSPPPEPDAPAWTDDFSDLPALLFRSLIAIPEANQT